MELIEGMFEKMWGKTRRGDTLPHGTGIGPGGLNICPTPGMRVRSGGRGRGLAGGRGRGPIGTPYNGRGR